MKLFFYSAIFSLVFTATAQAEFLTCRQTSLSTNGFSSRSVAQSWFPKDFRIRIEGEQAASDRFGRGTVEEVNGRKRIKFILADTKGGKNIMTITFIPKSSRYSAQLGGKSGFELTAGARGKCAVS